jgi:hypothetical protein
MTKTKVQSEKQKRKLLEIKQQHPHLSIINYDQFGKLFEPEIFPYKNKNRLYQDVSTNIENFLDSFHFAFRELPDSYKNKIIIGGNFNDFLNKIFTQLEFKKDSKTTDADFQNYSFQIYLKLFNVGIKGMIGTMPKEFRPYLNKQLSPILSLMQLIGKYENSELAYPSLATAKKTLKKSKIRS